MENAEYWNREHNRLHKRIDKDALVLDRLYRDELRKVEEKLKAFYARYADKNGLDIDTAKKMLSPKEFAIFNRKMQEWIRTGKYNNDVAFQRSIISLLGTSKINRLQQLQTELKANLSELKTSQKDAIESSLVQTYENAEDVVQNVVEAQFNQTSPSKIRTLINTEFQGRRLSDRIWTQRAHLSNKLSKTLTANMLEGKNWNDLKSDLKSTFGTTDYEARRLLVTETARINSVAKQYSFTEAGFTHYQYISVMDDRTSKICVAHDDKIYRTEDLQVGFNAPPLHVGCRSSISVYEKDEDEPIQIPPKNKEVNPRNKS